MQQNKSQQILKMLNQVNWVYRILFWVIIAFFGLIVVENFIQGLTNGIITLIISIFVALFLIKLVFGIINLTYANLQYTRCLKLMNEQLRESGISTTLSQQSKVPPSLFAIDTANKLLFINNQQTDYEPLVFDKAKLISAKVERESTVHTTTKHKGNVAVFGSSFGYNFGSKSTSTSHITETAFLELQYLTEQKTSFTLVIPYGGNRRGAEEALNTIQQF
ncbi:hypothetical protein [Testudinibacter aquarius]|uniref:Uncharacterized protein n=1 Tax=Testudinibacter aquarius TaxID=1524974 RepID=A0A4V2W1H6_9PAST|nr:hypothetical protein [Testudinibacter aquarius]KAE9528447.1 hypothetical protein A1D24_09510 [Testudinibacter aquarius]TCV84209.1 hypothetical protein EDC16_11240 [Testudinibacter aquarius]TNG92567.1 hypothetical protein FHQ21_04020 [Testudinibacter aquarius]